MKKHKFFLLFIIVCIYSLLFIATKRDIPCEGDCELVSNFGNAIRLGRESYVYGAYRCSRNYISDTLCVYVKDTTGINWNLLSDTACIIATQKGLLQQKIFIIKNSVFPPDTVARKQCP